MLGSESIRSGFHALGAGQLDESFAPRSTLETYTQAGVRGVGQAALPIGGTVAAGSRLALRAPSTLTAASPARQAVRESLVDAVKAPGMVAATELGGNIGANVAGEAANQFAPGNPIAQAGAQLLGGLAGGGIGYGATRRNVPAPPAGFQIADDLPADALAANTADIMPESVAANNVGLDALWCNLNACGTLSMWRGLRP
ncbi:MAG: hypothetical protein IPH79_09175 [Sphingomonadales bacterium]|nr:hypothetical protein [Sphingomonadales bacterium]